MRTLAVYLMLLTVVSLSLVIGFEAANFPTWCGQKHLCNAAWASHLPANAVSQHRLWGSLINTYY